MLALSASFEYLCCGTTTIINILILSVRGRLYLRLNLASVDGPRAGRVK